MNQARTTAGRRGSPHAPEAGWVARLLGRFHVTGTFWFRFHQFGVRTQPQFVVGPVIRLFTTVFFFVLLRIRRAIAANLAVALGPCGWFASQRRIYRTMHSFAWCLTERYERLSTDREIETTIENAEAWRRSTERTGVILITAHVGNWEIGSALPSQHEQRPVHLVREEELDPRAQDFIRGLLLERMGPLYTTHFATNDPALGIRLTEALERREIVALQADRPRAGGRTVPVELFGRPFEIPIGPMALARVTGVPLLPVFVLRTGRLRYRLCFREPIHVERTGNRQEAIADAAQAVAETIAWAVREAPHQWFCFRKLWDSQGHYIRSDAAQGASAKGIDERAHRSP